MHYTGIESIEELQQVLLRDVDTWLTADEAVKYGIGDIVEGRRICAEAAHVR